MEFNRRETLGGSATALLLAGLPGQARAISSQDTPVRLRFDTPRENVRTMARLTASLAGHGSGFVRYQGKAFGLLEDGRNLPLYDIDGIGALKALPQPDGAIRFLFNEFALYLDPATGLPLEQWKNPVTGRTVEVWHQRNGPVNYALDPAKAMFGAFARADGSTGGFSLPWVMRGPFATFALDVVADRPNPLKPADWPLESSGATLPTTEHSQYSMLRRDLENRRLTELPFFASLQSLKPWHPWMLMGQRPGRVFARLVAQRVTGPEVLPRASRAFAEKNLAAWMAPPTSWTGQYLTQHAIYMAGRKPQQ